MGERGLDYFTAKPGEIKIQECGVCGERCDVLRNNNGPTSWSEAMAKKSHRHDEFRCPYTEYPEHKQALQLIKLIDNTPSKTLAEIYRKDLEDALDEMPRFK